MSDHLRSTSSQMMDQSTPALDFEIALSNLQHEISSKTLNQSTPRAVVTTGLSNDTSDSVFLTYELCENVLRFLPFKDLLLAQRVCRKWRAVITRSKPLQQTLFFEPREAEFGWKYGTYFSPGSTDGPGSFVESLTKVVMRDQEVSAADAADDADDAHVWVLPSAAFCPVLESTTTIRSSMLGPCGPQKYSPTMSFRNVKGIQHKEASWRRMLLCQPPVRKFRLDTLDTTMSWLQELVSCQEFARMVDCVKDVEYPLMGRMNIFYDPSCEMLFPVGEEAEMTAVHRHI